ncbi:MAG: glycerate kinase [Salinarimonadaceae bacterium]|nr:MAG: glycerate kinase [Salinarimonadaceae bacterium]
MKEQHMNDQGRAALLRIFDAAVAAAHPSLRLPPHLPEAPARGRLLVLAAGKAAASMAEIAVAHYRDAGFDLSHLRGIAVARIGYGGEAGPVEVVEAGHPTPDEAGLAATRRVLALAQEAGPDDLALVLISGGGSANWVSPAEGIDLAEKQAITRALLRSGADIGEINTVRKRLSRIKGGRLARALVPARVLTLAISDVPGDAPDVIASGPTVSDTTTSAQALAIVERRGIALSAAARALLEDPANETPKPGDPAFARAEFRLIARPADAIEAAAEAVRREGYEPVTLGADLEGEARDVAQAHARLARELRAAGRRAAIISGGELTVTVRGGGAGGPNQEYALALAIALDGTAGICALAGDTDGTDGGVGSPDDPAGALIDETTLARAVATGLDAKAHLSDNDSTRFFETLGDLLKPGPTRTNVNDCRIILVN